MASNFNYEYINETSIDPELICMICSAPFNEPLCTPCDHTFCWECITGWINHGNLSCPTCRQQVTSVNNLVPANRTVRNMLDRLPIKCILCGTTGLQRGNFSDHTSKACSKVHVPCTSEDIKCPWKGPRDQLDSHVATCVFQPFRTILTELISESRQLKERVKQMETQIKQRDAQINSSINELCCAMKSALSTYQKRPCDNCRDCLYLSRSGDRSGGYYHLHTTLGYGNNLGRGGRCDCNCHET